MRRADVDQWINRGGRSRPVARHARDGGQPMPMPKCSIDPVLCPTLITWFDGKAHGGEKVADRSAVTAFGSRSEPRRSGTKALILKVDTALVLLAVLCSAGCIHLPWRRTLPAYEGPPPAQAKTSGMAAEPEVEAATAAMTDTDRQAMLEVLVQLQSMSGLSPHEREQLMADLRQTKPSLWPAMVQQFRAALAFRQQLQQRETTQAADAETTGMRLGGLNAPSAQPAVGTVQQQTALGSSSPQSSTPEAAAAATVEKRRPVTPAASVALPTPVAATPTAPLIHSAVTPAATASSSPRPTAALPTPLASELTAVVGSPLSHSQPNSAPLVLSGHSREPAKQSRPIPTEPNRAGNHTGAADASLVRQANSQGPADAGAALSAGGQTAIALADISREGLTEEDWHANLSRVIDDLEQETSTAPRTGTEVNRHAALRILYLIAGRRDDALQPIPGISPTLQDFWSKQLYGLATYLDSSQQPDSARRATVAKQYLCQAASRLGDLGLLTVQNLALCTEVSSFGVFRTFEQSEFKPGQEVLLYAEVNNFHSEETEKGFRTALRSSYQILDSEGKRVAQREFAVTEDYCKNRRRDFFMRYFIRLPVEIEPGSYMLELTIEDTLANKIGQSSLPLEIKTATAQGRHVPAARGMPLGH
jgi:hypothetical protein